MDVPLRLLPFGRLSLAVALAAGSLFMCGATSTRAESQAAASDAKAAPHQLDKQPTPKGHVSCHSL